MSDVRAKYAVEADKAYERGEWLFAEIARQRGAELAMRAPEEWELDRVLRRGDEISARAFIPYAATVRLPAHGRLEFSRFIERMQLSLEAELSKFGAGRPFQRVLFDSVSRAGYELLVRGVVQ